MISLINEAAELQEFFEHEGKDFFFVGGLALQIWGQPRLTSDIDCTIFTNLTNEDGQILELLNKFQSRFSDTKVALDHARIERVVLLKNRLGTHIDVLLSGLADTSEELARSSYQQFTKDIALRICSADSLIAYKTVAGRLKDYADIETILIKQPELEWEYIDQWLADASEYKDLDANITMLGRMRKEFCQT